MSSGRMKMVCVVFLTSCFTLVPFGMALNLNWVGSGVGNHLWDVGVNWNPATAPGLEDTVTISASPYQGPIIDASVNAECFRINGPGYNTVGENLMQITGGTLAIDNSWWTSVTNWGGGPGIVEITGGEITVGTPGGTTGFMAIGARGEATVTMTGGGATFGDNVLLGRYTSGSDRGTGVWNHVGGTLTTRRLFLGRDGGSGTLNLTGGSVSVSENILVGQSDDGLPAAAVVNIEGGTLTLGRANTPGDLFVRNNGNCKVNIGSGGTLIIRSDAVEHVEGLIQDELLGFIPEGDGWLDVWLNPVTQFTEVRGIHVLEPSPADGASVSSGSRLLEWTLPEPNFFGESVTCVVQFGTDPNNLSTIVPNQSVESVQVVLDFDKVYYWKVTVYRNGVEDMVGPLFTVSTVNQPPVVYVGTVGTWLAGEPRSLEMTPVVTDDSPPHQLTYIWSIVTDPSEESPAVILNPTVKNATIVLSETGVYAFQLEVSDGEFTVSNTGQVTVFADACEHASSQPGFEWLPGDFTQDCVVDMADLAEFSQVWLMENYSVE